MTRLQRLALWGGPLGFAGVFVLMYNLGGLPFPMAATAALTTWCAVWWVLEPLPIPATALLPLAGLPLLGVLDGSAVAQAYGDPMILLMMGGAFLSKGMEHSGAHRRIALGLINVLGGGNSKRLVLGFLLAAALISMWVSNTATALMLLPVAMAVVDRADAKLAVPLLLAVTYGCSIGGLATPIGTPPNIIFLKVYHDTTGDTISFLNWMVQMVPLAAVFLAFTGLWLTRGMGRMNPVVLPSVGPWQAAEKRVLLVFALTALAWMTMEEPFGGWQTWLGLHNVNYGSVALLGALSLFLLPAGQSGERLLNWEQAQKIEWGVLLLFAGGIALAKAFVSSGLSDAIGQQLAGLAHLPIWLTVLCISLGVTFLTEVTSNTATATLLMPILAAAAIAIQVEPALLMLPAALSASCAFMLPVATQPNAIVFASGKLRVQDMARAGLALNLMGAVLITLAALYLF
jgi:sodium-dependent dicarboxylate transporter 2/3/5